MLLEILVELKLLHSSADPRTVIVGVDVNALKARRINHNALGVGYGSAFNTSACAARGDADVVFAAKLDNLGNLFCRCGDDSCCWSAGSVEGSIGGVLELEASFVGDDKELLGGRTLAVVGGGELPQGSANGV